MTHPFCIRPTRTRSSLRRGSQDPGDGGVWGLTYRRRFQDTRTTVGILSVSSGHLPEPVRAGMLCSGAGPGLYEYGRDEPVVRTVKLCADGHPTRHRRPLGGGVRGVAR